MNFIFNNIDLKDFLFLLKEKLLYKYSKHTLVQPLSAAFLIVNFNTLT